jgi:DNA-binding response OmpR family regulator
MDPAADPGADTSATHHPADTPTVPGSAPEGAHREALARASHALKTPLAVIKGAATTLLADTGSWDAATQRELLHLIDLQVDRLHDLVNSLLDSWHAAPQSAATAPEMPATAPQPAPVTPTLRPRHVHERLVILVAGGDAHLARYLRANLEASGYRPLVAPNVAQLPDLIDQESPDLLLLDIGAPTRPVMVALRRVPECASVPTIVLGSGAEAECAHALDLGAVDYLAKPFGLDELLARVRAALRRAERTQAGAVARMFHSGELIIDFAQHQVRVAGRPVPLSRTEYKLLSTLAQHAGHVLTHEQLLERVWGAGYGQEVEFLWVYVRRLRRKIEPDPRNPRYILTVPGVGYRLAEL